jgi:hypothetical protein
MKLIYFSTFGPPRTRRVILLLVLFLERETRGLSTILVQKVRDLIIDFLFLGDDLLQEPVKNLEA